jgi:endonuclease YncB( thermonuclease family)
MQQQFLLGPAANNQVPMFTLDGIQAWVRVTDVHDADTVKIVTDAVVPGNLVRFSARLSGIDGAEITSHDPAIRAWATKGRDRLIELVSRKPFAGSDKKTIVQFLQDNPAIVWARFSQFDKYGRLLVTLHESPDERVSLNDELLRQDLAKVYTGSRKNGWMASDCR